MESLHFKQIVEELHEGIVVVDERRKVTYLNAQAKSMTGWNIGDFVPYCSYCQLRNYFNGETRCLLALEGPLPNFTAHMPNYPGVDRNFEMSVSRISIENEWYHVLVMRPVPWTPDSEEARLKQLLVQETMLAQEAERKRLARELHDQIGQSVYSLYLGLEGIKPHITNEDYRKHLNKMVTIMERTLQDIKRLTKELRPQLIDNLGLEDALREAVTDWEQMYQVKIECHYQIPDHKRLNSEQELHLFRVIQEAVHNAVRHGKAKQLKIRVEAYQNQIFFEIMDNGEGFHMKEEQPKGLGIKHMTERIHMLDGEIKWISQPGGPTRVEGFIPLNK
ncbi:sensor histidine kinase [Rubeoparvulum massiliense]|uniref:sensor histidine kinase n=1 Tax=Rubeoparvulum massiliense TaxID=1631346 RepID=UPI00065E712A|nr:histidine kinase [Rubeoparvulum massiliense]